MKAQIYTKKWELTSFALHCGYAQTRNNKTLTVVHNQYKVASLYETEYFDTLAKARLYLYKGIIKVN